MGGVYIFLLTKEECFMKIIEKVKKVFKQDKIQRVDRKLPYVNKPITEENADEIGMNVYVDYLESAIENGADMISVISRFGTGKSSLIALLKSKYIGWQGRGIKQYKRVYCEVNLWSQLECNANKVKKEKENEQEMQVSTVELHRTFLYQLVSSAYPSKSGFISKRTSRNFGMFKISAESNLGNVIISISLIGILILTFLQTFSEYIEVVCGISEDNLEKVILVGFIVCGVAALITMLKTEVVFSSKNSEGNRVVEENEIVDLYHKHILLPKHIWNRLKSIFCKRKHFVVIIEDLDRAENGDSVYLFLKELRKFYVPNEQMEKNFLNKITFIVNIMPEDKLQEKCAYLKGKDYVYDKLFDYALNLNRINIDNFDSILEALIQGKKSELRRVGLEIYEKNNVHKIPGIQWIIRGKQLSLRQVKERLNDSIILYESLTTKFNKKSIEFSKCIVVAYLRSAFSKEFYNLKDRELEEMLTWYAKNTRSEEAFVKEFGKTDENRKDFLRELYKMIAARLIAGDYRTYFFNFPKGSTLYSVQETNVRNLIIYNDSLTSEMEQHLKQVAGDKPEIIQDALKKMIELISALPEVVLFSEELWKIAHENFETELGELIAQKFIKVEEITIEEKKLIDSIIQMPSGALKLAEVISNIPLAGKVTIRQYILDEHAEKIFYFTKLYRDKLAPLTEEEIEKMNEIPVTTLLNMVTGTLDVLDKSVIDKIHSRVIADDLENRILANPFYTELISMLKIEEIVEKIVEYMIARNTLISQFESIIYEAIMDERIEKNHYLHMIYNVSPESIEQEQMIHFASLEDYGNASEELCKRMRSLGFNKEYLINMLFLQPSKIELSWEEVQDVIQLHGKEIWSKSNKNFLMMRRWVCEKYKDDVIRLEDFFMPPYPLVTNEEAQFFTILDTMFSLYDIERADKDVEAVFVNYCNRQFRNGKVAYKILCFVANMPRNMIAKTFYSLDMKMVRFSAMKKENKIRIVETLRVPLNMTSAKEILHFMEHTECLMAELESEILSDLKVEKNSDLCKQYIKIIKLCGKLTKETIKNIIAMPSIYAYGDIVNDELYKRKRYRMYICSKTMEMGKFIVEQDKLDILWNEYITIFNNLEKNGYTSPKMGENREFLNMICEKKEYGVLTDKSMIYMASILQDKDIIEHVFSSKENLIEDYFSKIFGFYDEEAERKFVEKMREKPIYAKKSNIYKNVYSKMKNRTLKGVYTRLYKGKKK